MFLFHAVLPAMQSQDIRIKDLHNYFLVLHTLHRQHSIARTGKHNMSYLKRLKTRPRRSSYFRGWSHSPWPITQLALGHRDPRVSPLTEHNFHAGWSHSLWPIMQLALGHRVTRLPGHDRPTDISLSPGLPAPLILFLTTLTYYLLSFILSNNYTLRLVFRWAGPGGTAMPGQPVTEVEQAPSTPSFSKNQFNKLVPRWGTYQMLSW